MSRDWKALREQFDRGGMFEKIAALPEQLIDAERRYRANEPEGLARPCRQVLLIGMGGSAIGGDIVAAAVGRKARVPVLVSRGYEVPGWCGGDTFVVATSYSGNTEETVCAAAAARDRGASLAAITTGGRLADLAAAGRFPVVTVPAGYPPRTAIGYLPVSALLLLETAGIAPPQGGSIAAARARLASQREAWDLSGDPSGSEPVEIALSLAGRIPVIYDGGGELEPVARRWTGQFAENAKTLAHRNSFPELCHNEIVGWEHPADLLERMSVLLLESEGDHPRVKKGMEAAVRLLEPYPARIRRLAIAGADPLERIFSSVYLGDVISYYLALGNGVDPTPVHRIDRLKSELAR